METLFENIQSIGLGLFLVSAVLYTFTHKTKTFASYYGALAALFLAGMFMMAAALWQFAQNEAVDGFISTGLGFVCVLGYHILLARRSEFPV